MKTLDTTQTLRVAGGLSTSGIDNKLQTALKVETSTTSSNGITAVTFSPSHPEGMLVRLKEYNAIFMAPNDSLSDELPLFPGLNDQGGTV